MAQIITPGRKPAPADWLVGKHVTCEACGCVWMIEHQDRHERIKESNVDYREWVWCPSCKARTIIAPPNEKLEIRS